MKRILFLTFLFSLASCESEKSELVFNAPVVNTTAPMDIRAFEETLHPVLKGNTCFACHSGTVTPLIAHSVSTRARDELIDNGKVNFNNPQNSRIYRRIKEERHNCGEISECDQLAYQVLISINNWKKWKAPSSPGETSGGSTGGTNGGSTGGTNGGSTGGTNGGSTGGTTGGSTGGTTGGGSGEIIKNFSNTVYPILRANCMACHATVVSPFIAHSNPTLAEEYVLQASKVDFENPTKSRLYRRLKDDLHNCNGDCNERAQEMLAAINDWKTTIIITDDRVQTPEVEVKNSQISYAQVSSNHFFEAEQMEVSGRMVSKVGSNASALKYLTTPVISPHPYSPSTRYGFMETACNENTANPYKLFNYRFNHPDVNGYHPYHLRLSFHLIRPDKRAEYLALLKSKPNPEFDDIKMFVWGTTFTSNDPTRIMTGVSLTMPTSLKFSPGIFPRGWDVVKFKKHRFTENNVPADYFKPSETGSTFSATPLELRNYFKNLQTENRFITNALYPVVARHIRSFYFDDAGNARVTPTNEGYTFAGNKSGEAGFEAVFPLKWRDSANEVDDVAPGNKIHEIDKYVFISLNATPIYGAIYTSPYLEGRIDSNCNVYNDVDPSVAALLACFQSTAILGPSPYWFNATSNSYLENNANQPYNIEQVRFGASDITGLIESERMSEYGNSIHPVVISNNCINCHAGQSSAIPSFAVNNLTNSYNAMVYGNLAPGAPERINIASPEDSRLYLHLRNNHNGNASNCGGEAKCAQLANDFLDAIVRTKTRVDALVANEGQETIIQAVGDNLLKPGLVKFKFEVTQAQNYKLYFRTRYSAKNIEAAAAYHFNYRLYRADNSIVPITRNSVAISECSKCQSEVNVGQNWSWKTDASNGHFALTPGIYELRIYERMEGIDIDQVGIVGNDYVPSAAEASIPVQIESLAFDISELTGVAGAKLSMVVEEYYNYYKLRDPKIISSKPIWVKGIYVKVNDYLAPYDLTYSTIKKRAVDSHPLTEEIMLVNKQDGKLTDTMRLQFDEIRQALPGDQDPIVPPIGENSRICRDMNYFINNIKPIFTRLGIDGVYVPNGYNYYQNFIRGMKANSFKNRMSFFHNNNEKHCISCHQANVPKFVMNPASDTALCSEILARVNFDDPSVSTIFRGILGYNGHALFQFMEVPQLDQSKNWINDTNSIRGKKIKFARENVFETYNDYDDLFDPASRVACQQQLNTDLASSDTTVRDNAIADQRYINFFIGMPKREMFILNTDANATINKTVMTILDKERLDNSLPLQVTSTYLNTSAASGCAVGVLCDDKRANIKRPFYPADYFCRSPRKNLALRLHPGPPTSCYNPDVTQIQNECTTVITPFGEESATGLTGIPAAQNYNTNDTNTNNSRGIHKNNSLFIPVLKSGISLDDIVVNNQGVFEANSPEDEEGREVVYELIYNWILREKALQPSP